jgi:hypothetical protein
MSPREHRVTPRFKLQIPLSFQRILSASEGEYQASALNISTSGVYFATTVALCINEALEVLLEMPGRVNGAKTGLRRFAGRVTHIEAQDLSQGLWGIGVQLHCVGCE